MTTIYRALILETDPGTKSNLSVNRILSIKKIPLQLHANANSTSHQRELGRILKTLPPGNHGVFQTQKEFLELRQNKLNLK